MGDLQGRAERGIRDRKHPQDAGINHPSQPTIMYQTEVTLEFHTVCCLHFLKEFFFFLNSNKLVTSYKF